MAVTTVAALAALAIVAQDQVPLRAAPRDNAAQHAVLWQGDSLEIRGEKGDYLQVYDHRHERAGYVKTALVRTPPTAPEQAQELLAVVRFLREAPGAETLGIGYAAAYLKAAPAKAIDGEIFYSLGRMAERLARRATQGGAGTAGQTAAAQLEVAAAYGVEMKSFEREGSMQICYNGDAFRRTLALPASDAHKAEAALALTRHDCIAPDMTPTERYQLDNWRMEVLDRVATTQLPPVLKNRIQMRKAGVLAGLVYQRARRAELGTEPVRQAAMQALDALAGIDKGELTDNDQFAYNDAAVRVGAARWGVEVGMPARIAPRTGAAPDKVSLSFTPGQPGETCIQVLDAKHGDKNPLLRRCTYGLVWPSSATMNGAGNAITLAVQTTPTWRELWMLQRTADGWVIDMVPPSADGPAIGYVEFAGWLPDGKKYLSAREARIDGRYQQRYELRRVDTQTVENFADKPGNLNAFHRWQSAVWKSQTVSLR